MGLGSTRQRVYNLVLRITRRALDDKHPGEVKPVSQALWI